MKANRLLLGVCLALLPLSCGVSDGSDRAEDEQESVARNKPAVVATTSVICDLTRQLSGSAIDLTCLLDPGQDPHTYQPAPSDRIAIDDAALILYGGYSLSPEIEQLIEASPNPAPRVAIYEAAVPEPRLTEAHEHGHGHEGHADESHLEVIHSEDLHGEEQGHEHEGHADESHVEVVHSEELHGEEHDHNEEAHALEEEHHDSHHDEKEHDGRDELVADPHVWHSASNGVELVEAIAKELRQIVPDHTESVNLNEATLKAELIELHEWIEEQVATVPQADRRLITTHESFGYFADAYGFETAGTLTGVSNQDSISADDLADSIDLVRDTGINAIFAESSSNRSAIETVAQNAGINVPEQPLYVDGPGGPGTPAETYQDMLAVNTCTIVNGLGGTCTVDE